jgi:hypothetical protein
MGIVNFGIPEQETEYLRSAMGLQVVVEGGTYKGGTASLLSKSFDKVYTIEKSDVMYAIAQDNLKDFKNVNMLKGDTREHLVPILAVNDNILFWLDAHWSGGETYGEGDECPLLQELGLIFSSTLNNYAIMVDDARLFISPPPLPHDFNNWPTIKEICSVVPDDFDILISNDVIYLTPVRVDFRSFIQKVATSDWFKYTSSSAPTFRNCAKAMVKTVLGR